MRMFMKNVFNRFDEWVIGPWQALQDPEGQNEVINDFDIYI